MIYNSYSLWLGINWKDRGKTFMTNFPIFIVRIYKTYKIKIGKLIFSFLFIQMRSLKWENKIFEFTSLINKDRK